MLALFLIAGVAAFALVGGSKSHKFTSGQGYTLRVRVNLRGDAPGAQTAVAALLATFGFQLSAAGNPDPSDPWLWDCAGAYMGPNGRPASDLQSIGVQLISAQGPGF